MITRRNLLGSTGLGALLGQAFGASRPVVAANSTGTANDAAATRRRLGYTPTTTLNGTTLPYVMEDGVKEFHLIAQEFEQEFAPGMKVKVWGYNGSSPGPTLEAAEGDQVRILVTNELPEHTTIHWHGIFLPNGMDGVGGLTQPQIGPGETFVYEFPLVNHGTFLYHPHADEMVQMAVGMMGMFIVHPKRAPRRIDRDFVLLNHEWAIHPGTYRPDPSVMLDFNIFTINGKVFPEIDSMVVKTGDLVRIRVGNLSMNQHPMHIHGYAPVVTGSDGGPIPEAAQFPHSTVAVPVGSARDLEFVADVPGDWPFHCHKSHHTMNAMAHELPNMLGVDQGRLESKIRQMLPGYMAMGEFGMAEHQDHSQHMKGPANTLPMMAGVGPFGNIEMGGMFTMIKVRDQLASYDQDPGWYDHPEGTVAYKLEGDNV